MHGGVPKTELSTENLAALEKGFENLAVHIENIAKFGLPAVVAINKFVTDTDAEIELLQNLCSKFGARAVLSEGWEKGGKGASELAKVVVEVCETEKSNFHHLYEADLPLADKIRKIATEIYRAKDVEFLGTSLKKLKEYEELGYKAYNASLESAYMTEMDLSKMVHIRKQVKCIMKDTMHGELTQKEKLKVANCTQI